MKQHPKILALCCAVTLLLAGCGGGGGGGDDSQTNPPPVAQIIIFDEFSDGTGWTSRWELKNDTNNGPMDWAVVNGQLQQRAFLESDALDPSTSYHTGAFAYLDPVNPPVSPFPTDYRFSVDVTPLTNDVGDSEGNDVGIMFRYKDANNYYRLTMSAKFGFTRLEKRVGGAFRTLAVNAIGYVDNQPMTLAAEVNGSRIVVWIDGDPVFAVVDASIPSGTVALFAQDKVAFDNVRITETPVAPLVAISSPLAYSVIPGNPVNLTVSAVALNVPAGGSVVFSRIDSLGGTITQPATSAFGDVYSTTFSNVGPDDYIITASLRDAAGAEVDEDTNLMVGTGGDYYITLGDSITNGVGDFNPSNNDSLDGRIVSIQGFQARLANRLTAATGRPQIVFNEGIEGDEANELDDRLFSLLERHPRANKVLVLIGTNDSGGSSPTPVATFRADVQAIADEIEARGKSVWIAEILPVLGNAARNTIIQDYNTEIRSITGGGGDATFLGPNLYTAFDGKPNLYTDTVHPNDAGFTVMADQWYGKLAP